MFVVHVELLADNNTNAGTTTTTLLATSKRAARWPHTSAWIATVRNLATLPALLLGALDESRTITITPFHHFVEPQLS